MGQVYLYNDTCALLSVCYFPVMMCYVIVSNDVFPCLHPCQIVIFIGYLTIHGVTCTIKIGTFMWNTSNWLCSNFTVPLMRPGQNLYCTVGDLVPFNLVLEARITWYSTQVFVHYIFCASMKSMCISVFTSTFLVSVGPGYLTMGLKNWPAS